MVQCKFCNKSFNNFRQNNGHMIHCKLNPKPVDLSKKRKPLSNEHKAKISASRKKFLNENPNKVPYILNHSSQKSWPEKIFEKLLNDNDITGYHYNYPFMRYRFDFCFPDLLIDIEIDGSTHNLEKVKQIDQERDLIATKYGWKILRIDASLLYHKENHQIIINEVKKILNENSLSKIILTNKKHKQSLKRGEAVKLKHDIKNENTKILIINSNIDFSKFGWVSKVAKLIGITPQKTSQWMKRHLPELYKTAYKRNH